MTNSVVGEELQKLVLVWFDERYPDWRVDWIEGEFDEYSKLPIELRMIPAFSCLEHNIINGGWSQFLWNCFGSWRQLIETVGEGYRLIGGAAEELEALRELETLCERDELECGEMLELEDGSMKQFQDFTSRSYGSEGNNWEKLFWPGAKAYWRRLSWLGEKESRIRAFLVE